MTVQAFKRSAMVALWANLLGAPACLFDGELKHDTGVVPERLDDGWEVDTPEDVGLSAAVLDEIHEQLLREDRYRGVLGFLVVKDGKLVFETYLRSRADQEHYGHVQSVTKTVTSMLLGIALERGLVPSLELTVGEVFDEESRGLGPEKRSITLQQLLTMTSGLRFDNDVFSVEMWVEQPSNPIRYVLEKPLYAEPGERFYYRDADPQLVGYALTRLTGMSEAQLARRFLFGKLGIENFYWEAGRDGVQLAAHGLHLTARDLAKLGLLALDRGFWEGESVVPENWIEMSTSPQVDSDVDHAGRRLPYGYYWWVVPGSGHAMWGHGGQFVLVVPEQNLVLVQTAFPDTDLPDGTLPEFLDLVAPLLAAR